MLCCCYVAVGVDRDGEEELFGEGLSGTIETIEERFALCANEPTHAMRPHEWGTRDLAVWWGDRRSFDCAPFGSFAQDDTFKGEDGLWSCGFGKAVRGSLEWAHLRSDEAADDGAPCT